MSSRLPPTAGTLPEIVERFAARSAYGGRVPRQVRLTQTGRMLRAPGARPMRFTATQSIDVGRVGFRWRARFPLGVSVVDEFAAGRGTLAVRLLGIPVLRQDGPQMDTGEALRYLSELPLAPFAMAANPDLGWRAIDDRTAEVAVAVGGDRVSIAFGFDAEGDIVTARTTARAMRSEGAWTTAPWGGSFRDYATVGGIRFPTRADAYWDLAEGRFVYWSGEITSVAALS